jgi:hypothetical protein
MPPASAADLPMFFFGTLMDGDVQEAVLGHPVPADALEPACLSGWKRVAIAGRAYPMLIPHATGKVEGCLVQGLSELDRLRLDHYEGPEYRLGIVMVRLSRSGTMAEAAAYLCPAGVTSSREEWRLDSWRLRHKRAALTRIRAMMAGLARHR